MERTFEHWLVSKGMTEGIKGYLKEIRFTNKETKRNGWADFVFPQLKLIIELDGNQHRLRVDLDQERDDHLRSRGWKVIRITHGEYVRKTRIHEIESLLEIPGGIEPRTVLPTFNGPA